VGTRCCVPAMRTRYRLPPTTWPATNLSGSYIRLATLPANIR
jgi:hypothetical protein